MSRFRLQSDEERNKYLNQLYGGKPPSMDYYRQLGVQKGQREAAARAAKEAQKAAEKAAKEKEKETEKAKKEAEKKAEDEALQKLLKELSSTSPSKTTLASSNESQSNNSKSSGGLFSNIGGLFKDIGSNAWHVGSTAAKGVGNLAKVAFTDYTMDDMRRDAERQAEVNKKEFKPYSGNHSSGLSREVDRAVKRAGSAASFGMMEDSIQQQGFDTSAYEQRGGAGAVGDTIYGILGSLGPGGAIASGVRGTRLGANVLPGMSKMAKAGQYAKEGAVAGGLYGGVDAYASEALNPGERSLMQHLGNIGLEAGIGSVADPAIMGLFGLVGKGAKQGLGSGVRARGTGKNVLEKLADPKPVVSSTPSARNVYNHPVPEIDLPSYSRLPEFETSFQTSKNYDPAVMKSQPMELPKNKAKIEELLNQKYGMAQRFEDMRGDFIDQRTSQYKGNPKAVSDAEATWASVKDMRDEYKRIVDHIGKNNVRIPDHMKSDFEGVLPRSLIQANHRADKTLGRGDDIFKVAEEFGFEGTQAAQEFAQHLRNLQQASNVRKKDLVNPNDLGAKPKEIRQIEDIQHQTFNETPDAIGMRQVIDSFDDEISKLHKSPDISDFLNIQANTRKVHNPLDDLGLPKPKEVPTNKKIMDIGNRQADATKEKSLLNKKDRLLVEGSDRFRATKVVERKIKDAGGDMFENAYRDQRLVAGAEGSGEVYLKRNFQDKISELEKRGLKMEDGFEYINSLHLNRVKELNPDYVLPGGANKAQMQNRISQLGKNEVNKEFAATIKKIQRDMLDLGEKEGLISSELKKELVEKFPNYFPLFRNKNVKTYDDMLNQFTSGNVRKVIHELENGSTDLLKDPLDNLISYVMNMHQAAFTNRAMRHISSLDKLKLNGHLLAKDVTNSKVDHKRTIKFKENGVDRTFELHPDLFKSYSELKTVMDPNRFVRFVEGIAKVQRTSITANPIFTTKQLFRDIPEAYVNGKFSLVKDLVPAFFDMISGGKIKNSQLDNFFKHGAGYGNIVSMDRNANHALKRAAQKLKGHENIKDVAESSYTKTIGRVIESLRRFNESAENLPKLAQFRATARKTGDLDQAAFDARDIMDFSMSGSTVQKMNRSVAFINANIRGKERFARALKDDTLSTMMKTAVVGGGMSTIAYMAYDNIASDSQKSIIENAPEWMKQTYWLFPSPNGENIVRIPKPYEMVAISSTPIEFALYNDSMVGSDIKDYLVNWATEAFLADVSLNPVTPLYEAALDKDTFTKRSITNPRERHLDTKDQKDVYTPFTAELLGKIPGISPRVAEHLMQGYLPQSMENVNDLIDRAAEMAGLRQNEKPAGSTGMENPVFPFNPFALRGTNMSSNKIGHLYEAADDVQGLKKRTQESGELFQFPNAYTAINKIKSEDQSLAGQIRTIDNDPNLDRETKQMLREQLIAQRNEFANSQTYGGRTDTSEQGLANLESEFSGLGSKQTKADIKTVLASQLAERGVPRHVIDEVMKQDLTNVQLAEALQYLLQNY